jgi:hypothetical protein
MKLSIMQPYFFPYIGYFQLISATNQFVIYDNIKYTKKGWINRNRFLLNSRSATFSIPLAHGSDFLDIRDRRISPEYRREKLTRQLESAYQYAPQFESTFPLILEIINNSSDNLFEYVKNSVQRLCHHLEIDTKIVISSRVIIDHKLKSKEKILALCQKLGADEYVNSIGGLELYSYEAFKASGVTLKFVKSKPIQYPQFKNDFIPSLSIIDVLMFNPLSQVKQWVQVDYDLI